MFFKSEVSVMSVLYGQDDATCLVYVTCVLNGWCSDIARVMSLVSVFLFVVPKFRLGNNNVNIKTPFSVRYRGAIYFFIVVT
jgi:hypothetical protein